jgi:hypothetical protein
MMKRENENKKLISGEKLTGPRMTASRAFSFKVDKQWREEPSAARFFVVPLRCCSLFSFLSSLCFLFSFPTFPSFKHSIHSLTPRETSSCLLFMPARRRRGKWAISGAAFSVEGRATIEWLECLALLHICILHRLRRSVIGHFLPLSSALSADWKNPPTWHGIYWQMFNACVFSTLLHGAARRMEIEWALQLWNENFPLPAYANEIFGYETNESGSTFIACTLRPMTQREQTLTQAPSVPHN